MCEGVLRVKILVVEQLIRNSFRVESPWIESLWVLWIQFNIFLKMYRAFMQSEVSRRWISVDADVHLQSIFIASVLFLMLCFVSVSYNIKNVKHLSTLCQLAVITAKCIFLQMNLLQSSNKIWGPNEREERKKPW